MTLPRPTQTEAPTAQRFWAQIPDAAQEDGGGGLLGAAVDAAIPGGLPLVGVPGVDGLASGISDGLLDSLEAKLDEALVGSATRVHEEVFGALDSTTTIDIGSLQGGGPLAMTTAIGVTLVLVFFFAAIVRGLLRGEYSAIIRAALVDVPLALVGTLGLVTFAQLLLGVTDAATAALLDSAAADLGETNLLGGQGLLGAFVLLVYIVAALLTWLWLFMRAALIYFIIAAAPLGLATRAFPPAAVFARRTIEMAVALIVSKFFLAIALSLGASYFNASAGGDAGLSTMLVSAALMVLAAFMPSVVLKLIPIAEGATAAAGVERAPLRMAAAAGGIAIAAGTFGSSAPVAASGGGTAPGPGGGMPSAPPTASGGPNAAPSSTSTGGSAGNSGAGGGGGSGGSGSSGPTGAGGSGGVSVTAIGGGGVGRVPGRPASSGGDGSEA